MGGTDDANNLVNLTAREHYIAHLLLVQIAKSNNNIAIYKKMLYAFNCMKWGRCKGKRAFKFNSRLYQKIKEEYSKLRCKIMKTKSNPMRNRIWIHSIELKQNKCWNKELPIPSGWEKGRVFNWDSHLDYKALRQNHILPQHLTPEERLLLSEHKVNYIIQGRQNKKLKKQITTSERINQIQEIANYYMEYGYEKTKHQYKNESVTKSMVLLLKTFSYYKQKYGIKFVARNNTPGVVNGSYFKKD